MRTRRLRRGLRELTGPYAGPVSHPRRFDPDDPYLERLRRLCLALPEAAEKVAHGRPTFHTVKVFAYYGGSVKGDHGSDRYGCSVLFVPDPDERPALLDDERVFEPAYLGPSGWLGLDFRPAGSVEAVDWAEVGELLDASYRLTAPKRLVAALDARGDRG
ncbi:YjbR protein [Terracoccus luteus]|uniref:YjbR protein n=1 Tax=Terracoccus luteus TaxID=53356 RepID=A0A495Y2V8_9MICO|nr:YjbR protein [Terracoccus luteus]